VGEFFALGLFDVTGQHDVGCVEAHPAERPRVKTVDFFSLENLRLVYKNELSVAKAHVQAKKKPNNGNALSKEKRNKMVEYKIDCVHCGTLLSGNNYNTEHILDLNLGGSNTLDNKMLMCKICNSARAELKVSLLGNEPTIGAWNSIEAYVIWNFVTVDYGHARGANVPSVHREFLRLASGGRERERTGTRWFARASNTTLAVPSSGGANTPRPRPRDAPNRSRGLFSFDWRGWFRGSAQDRDRTRTAPSPAPQAAPRPTEEAQPAPDPVEEVPDITVAQLRSMILEQIPAKGEIKQAQLGNQVKRSDPFDRSLRVLFLSLGRAKSTSMNTLLEDLLAGQASYRDDGTVRYWSRGATSDGPTGQTHQPVKATSDNSTEKRQDIVKSLFVPHLPTTEFAAMSTLVGRIKYADPEKRSTKTITTEAGYPKSWGLMKILKDAFGSELEVQTDEQGKGEVRLKPSEPPPLNTGPMTMKGKHASAGNAFRDAVTPYLPEIGEACLLTKLSNVVQEQHDSELSLKRLGIEFGFPKTWTARKMLEHAFQGSVEFDGTGSKTYIRRLE